MRPSRTSPIKLLLLLALPLGLATAGCQPTCEEVCDKVVECDDLGTERMPPEECKESCLQQKALYATWTDTQLRDAFDDELSCIDDSSCDDIAAGVCYDEDLWSF